MRVVCICNFHVKLARCVDCVDLGDLEIHFSSLVQVNSALYTGRSHKDVTELIYRCKLRLLFSDANSNVPYYVTLLFTVGAAFGPIIKLKTLGAIL